MGTTAYVRDFRGIVLDRGSRDLHHLLAAARAMKLPFLGHVDEYDDTVFNRLQLSVLIEEIDHIRLNEGESHALEELARLVSDVRERPHRYLVFSGD